MILQKLKVNFMPNCREIIIKLRFITPLSFPINPPREKSILFRKNSFTTLSGKIQPINSPKIDPNIVPKKRMIMINDKDLFFISCLKSKFFSKISHLSKFLT